MDPSGNGAKPSKVEAIKIASQYLRTFVADEVRNGPSHFSEDAASVLKFHGSYQQDDRDLRTQMKREGKEKAFQFMVRVRIVGGKLDGRSVPGHRRAGADGRQRHAPDHDAAGVPAPRRPQGRPGGDHPPDQREPALDAGRLRRRRAERPLLPRADPRRGSRRDAGRRRPVRRRTAPRGRRATGTSGSTARRSTTRCCPTQGPIQVPTPGDDPIEPIYGKAYLPRKFKTAFALPDDNCTDVHANDLGYLAVVEEGSLVGYNVLVGGGLGTTPSARRRSRSWACRSATSTAPTCSRSARRCSRSSATSAIARTASAPG